MDKKSILENLRQYSEAELLYKAFFSHETEFHPTERFYQEYNLKKAVDFSGVEPKEIFHIRENNSEASPVAYGKEGPSIYLKKHRRYIPHLEHAHDFFEMIYPLEGNCTAVVADHAIRLREGQICIISPYIPHHIEDANQSIVIKIYIETRTFYGALINALRDDSILSSFFLQNIVKNHSIPCLCFDSASNRELKDSLELIILNLLEEQEQPDQRSGHIISSLLVLYFAYLGRYCPKPMEQTPAANILPVEHRQLILDIIQNCHEISLKELAKRHHYSPTYISKLIRQITGESYSCLVQNCRIQRAKTMLSGTSMPVEVISGTLGYANTESFIRAFKKNTGMTPSRYRKSKSAAL